MKGILPMAASPDATEARFCSATPTWINRLGNFSLNKFILVDSVKSAQSPTTCGFFSPAASNPSPNPWRLGTCSTSLSNIFAFSFKSGFNMLFVFTFYLTTEGAEFFDRHLALLFVGRFTMPAIIAFELWHALACDGVGYDYRWFAKYGLSRLEGVSNFFYFGPVYFNHMPIPGPPLVGERLKRHDILRVSFYLNIISVDDGGKIVKFLLAGEHGRFPSLSAILLTVGKKRVDAAGAGQTMVHFIGKSHTNRLGKSGAKGP